MRRPLALAACLVAASVCLQADTPLEDPVAAGRRLYREGLLASGEASTALVQGDVPVLGTQFTCLTCHRRSGMGANESGRIVPPLAGPVFLAPGRQPARPAYSEAALGRALREGIAPGGRPLDPLMPRYRLPDADVAALFAYLSALGATPSPGVGASSLHLATVVAGDVPAETEEAMVDVLGSFFSLRNRSAPQRLPGGHAPGQPKEALREWSLDVWRLDGPAETWREKLEARQRERPAFALVGGIAAGTWQPVHDFCEATEVPCLLPLVDLPPVDDAAYYSFYFSRGLHLEAEVIASRLAAEGLAGEVVQVIGGRSAAAGAAETLTRALARWGGGARVVGLDDGHIRDPALARAAAVVLWLTADETRHLAPALPRAGGPLFLSSTLLGSAPGELPEPLRTRGRVVHLSSLPGEVDPALARFRAWARARGVRVREENTQALAYFAALAFAEGAKHLGRFPQRDYLVDLLDHASNLTAYLPLYRRASVSPGQRVLSRGGWVVDVTGGRDPLWVVP
ncbi:MAG TPA: c-type cytochrome [Vicinamibacteria bacterium]